MVKTTKISKLSDEQMQERLKALGLYGVLGRYDELSGESWLQQLVAIEEEERHKRGLARRIRDSRIGPFKALADYDWTWPHKVDRAAIEDLFTLKFIEEGINPILIGPNGVGKTMILTNVAHHAITQGQTVRVTSASDMLADLAAQDSPTALTRRLRRYTQPKLLCVDEVGYLSYSARYADLLFEVVTRRYESRRPIMVSTNKAFADWSEVFPHAACTVTLVDRLVHRSEILEIDGGSYRLKEAKEIQARRSAARKKKAK